MASEVRRTGETKSIIKTKYAENPFTLAGVFTVPKKMKGTRVQTVGPMAVTDSHTGETMGVAEIRKVTEVDSDRFVKVFVGQLNAFYDLKPGSMKILTMVLHEVARPQNMNSDRIYLNYDMAIEHFESQDTRPPAKGTFYAALAELTEKGFIAPATKLNLWFINPAIFFNGDRIRFTVELRKKRMSAAEKLEEAGQARLFGEEA
ncbi:MAG: hypothetical protein KGN33_18710 [Paracoccaceae bacterium]|nr:hypothetical protein [Paracoccaceae bacterium]